MESFDKYPLESGDECRGMLEKVRNVSIGIRPGGWSFVNEDVPSLEKVVETPDVRTEVSDDRRPLLAFVLAPQRLDRGELIPKVIAEDSR